MDAILVSAGSAQKKKRNTVTLLRLKAVFQRAANLAHIRHGEIEVQWVNDRIMRKVNSTYRHTNVPTDVLSFAHQEDRHFPKLPGARRHLGQIFINRDEVRRRARQQHARQEDVAIFFLVHGFLHCTGFDHATPSEERRMRKMERRICSQNVYYS
jgi:probable rRNA maturation factor